MRSSCLLAAGAPWGAALLAFVVAGASPEARAAEGALPQPVIGARVVGTLQADGLVFRDLNKNGKLDAYEDWRRPVAERVEDLVAQMTLEEKAGLMVGPSLAMGPGGAVREEPVFGVNPFAGGPPALVSPGTTDALHKRHIVQFINRENVEPRTMATWTNAVQQVAEARRLGTPVLFVTNPRNHYGAAATFGIAEASAAFSQWPGTLGFAATRDPALVEEFGRHRRAGVRRGRDPGCLPPDGRRRDRAALGAVPGDLRGGRRRGGGDDRRARPRLPGEASSGPRASR